MKTQKKIVWGSDGFNGWNPIEFRSIKENTVFTFDKTDIFTASCDSYMLTDGPDAGTWSVLVVNKDMESFFEARKKEQEDKLSFLLSL
ncbi:MAG: hypothetical protein Q7K54_03065 [Candidatus Parcubacteria bacterium]|nr:hypothetical protein [Candidatus Parcubacteria bacterium]